MTVSEAIREVRKVGSIRAENGKLKVRFPEPERARLEPAMETLRHNRETALQKIEDELESVLKGQAIELYLADGDRLFIVADEAGAAMVGERRGLVYTAAEVRSVIRIEDPATVAEVHRWKKEFDGILGEVKKP